MNFEINAQHFIATPKVLSSGGRSSTVAKLVLTHIRTNGSTQAFVNYSSLLISKIHIPMNIRIRVLLSFMMIHIPNFYGMCE